MTNITFDLVDIVHTIRKHFRFILIVTLAGVGLAGGFLLIKPKKYKAEARFLVNNPLYGDRSTLFRNIDTRYVDYYGGDDDVDKIMALANSDTVRGRIMRNSQFQLIYKRDINNDKDYAALMTIFKKSFNIKRTEYNDVTVSYVAYEPQTAANVANMSVQVLEEMYRNYYNNVKVSLQATLKDQILVLDSAINTLTDSLANMRDRYGIYSIISPARQNVVSGEIHAAKGMGRAVEELQNVESIKDQLVIDRARYISALNEFAASTNPKLEFLKVVSRAVPPLNTTGLGTELTLVAAGLLSFFFCTLYILIIAYYRRIVAVAR